MSDSSSDVPTSDVPTSDASATPGATATVEKTEVSAPEAKPKEFKFSALISAVGRFFRNFVPLIIVIVINALVQAILVGTGATVGFNFGFLLLTLISLAAFLWAFYYIARVALEGTVGKPSVSDIFNKNNGTFGKFALWSLALWLVTLIALILLPWAAVLVLILFVYVPIAAANGKANPIKANFAAIKDRWGHWLMTSIILFVIIWVLMLLTAANGFFIGGFAGSLITWLVWGVFASWVMLAYGLIYRSTRVGAAS